MKKAGGIVALIAGILGFLAAVATLMFGGLATAFKANGSELVVGLGWGGIVFSIIVIVLGAVSLSARTKLPSTLLVFTSLAGAVLGGSFVAVCMALALVGGVLAFFGTKNPSGSMNQKKMAFVSALSFLVLAMIISSVWRAIGSGPINTGNSHEVAELEAPQTQKVEVATKVDICKEYSSNVRSSNLAIKALDKPEPLDNVKHAKLIKLGPLIGGLTPEYPGVLKEECIADVYYYDGQKSKITYVVSQSDNDELYVAYKDISGITVFLDAAAMLPQENGEISKSQQTFENTTGQLNAQVSPSFDCTRASKFVEITICRNPKLAELDVRLARQYQEQSKVMDLDVLQRDQQAWLKQRNDCYNEQCIEEAYQLRSAQLAAEMD